MPPLKYLFTTVCAKCANFRPNCVMVRLRDPFDPHRVQTTDQPICEECRQAYRGTFRIDARHK